MVGDVRRLIDESKMSLKSMNTAQTYSSYIYPTKPAQPRYSDNASQLLRAAYFSEG